MPEGPEIHVDSEQLDFFLSNRTMLSVELIGAAFKNRCDGLEELQGALPLRVTMVRSRGKKLYIFLQAEGKQQWVIVIGYGMTGNMGQTKQKHSHLAFKVSHHSIGFDTFYYSDARRFGTFDASDNPDDLKTYLSETASPVALGYPDEKGFEPISREQFTTNIGNCKTSYLASRLMDQKSICSGVGNYILSEVFYEARLDPFIQCDELTSAQIQALWDTLHKVMIGSYEHGGMSMSDYVNADGNQGRYEDCLLVYGKANKSINGHLIYKCKGPHGRAIFFTDENGADTLSKAEPENDDDGDESE
jgi:formamidopyrimidine-DNA glycosylase